MPYTWPGVSVTDGNVFVSCPVQFGVYNTPDRVVQSPGTIVKATNSTPSSVNTNSKLGTTAESYVSKETNEHALTATSEVTMMSPVTRLIGESTPTAYPV